MDAQDEMIATAVLGLLRQAEDRLRSAGTVALGIFGSVARGTEAAGSDIDVVVVCRCADEDAVGTIVRDCLRPLRRALDINYASNLGIGSRLWANVAGDAVMAFGELPVARPRLEPIRLDSRDGMAVLAVMVARWSGLGVVFERCRCDVDEDIGVLARRWLASVATVSVGTDFIRHFDETAVAVLGRDRNVVPPALPGPDPRKVRREATGSGEPVSTEPTRVHP